MPSLDIEFIGYAPDADLTTTGVITDCAAFIPSINGYVASPSPADVGIAALAAECRGAFIARKLDETTRLLTGTQTKLYERSGATWTDVSKAGSYTGGAENRWRMCQFGNVTIATNRTDSMQASTSGAFADLAGTPPKASIVETVGNFVMAFDYNDGTNDYPDGWWSSGIGNHTTWTPSSATQAANGRLLDVTGQIKAARKLGDNVIVYKERGMWVGVYQGPPVIWAWQLIPGDVGAVSQEAVVEITYNGGPAHIFMGQDDFYLYDGSRPVSIGTNRVRRFLQDNIANNYRYKTVTSHDRRECVVRFYFVSVGGTTITKCLAYNYRTNQWGRDDYNVTAAIEYLTASQTIDGLSTQFSTIDSIPSSISFDSPFWSSAQASPAVFNTSNVLMSLTGASGASSYTTGLIGDANQYTTLTRVRPKNISDSVSTATCTNYWRHDITGTEAVGSSVTRNKGKFDILRSARWHRLKFDQTGSYVTTGLRADYETDGIE